MSDNKQLTDRIPTEVIEFTEEYIRRLEARYEAEPSNQLKMLSANGIGGYLVPAYHDVKRPGKRAAFYRWLYRRVGLWRWTKRGWMTVKFELFEEEK